MIKLYFKVLLVLSTSFCFSNTDDLLPFLSEEMQKVLIEKRKELTQIANRIEFDPLFHSDLCKHFSKHKKCLYVIKDLAVLKKRWGGTTPSDIVAWEIALLLELSQYIPPADYFDLENACLAFQQYVEAKGDKMLNTPRVQELDLVSYWEINLLIYILGAQDQNSTNIAISEEGTVHLWDLEHIFGYGLPIDPYLSNTLINSHLFHEKLQQIQIQALTQKIQTWVARKHEIKTYLQEYSRFRLNDATVTALLNRIDRIAKVSIDETTSLYDFSLQLFPHELQNFSKLSALYQKAHHHQIPMGSTFFWAAYLAKKWGIPQSVKDAVNEWIESIIHAKR